MVLVATIYALPVDNSAVEEKDDLETAQQFFGGYGGYGGYGGGGFGGGYCEFSCFDHFCCNSSE